MRYLGLIAACIMATAVCIAPSQGDVNDVKQSHIGQETAESKMDGLEGLPMPVGEAKAVTSFDEVVAAVMKMGRMSAMSAAIVQNGELRWSDGFGLYDRERNRQAADDTIYLVASITKTVTATAVMQLYERGKFELDDDVSGYLPFLLRNPHHPGEPITFRMLLAHQSSLANDDPAGLWFYMPGEVEIPGYPYPWLAEHLQPDGSRYRPQAWSTVAPGGKMQYTNVGFGLLGYLVEVLSGQSLEAYCQENIFKPLGMENTSFLLTGLNQSNIARPYVVQDGELFPLFHYDRVYDAAGGLRTTVLDLSRYLVAHMKGGAYGETRILKPSSIQDMHTIQYPSDTYRFQYGMGFMIWETPAGVHVGHTGANYGVATQMKFLRGGDTGIIFFTNKQITNPRELLAFSLLEQLLFWKANHGGAIDMRNLDTDVCQHCNLHLLAAPADALS